MKRFGKKALALLLCLVLALALSPLTALPARAYSGGPFTSGQWEYTVTDGKATVTYYSGSDQNVAVPATLGIYPVTAIGNLAFYGKANMTSVTLPESVAAIELKAFQNCTSLMSVYAPGLRTIGSYAFDGCSALQDWDLPESLQEIGYKAFSG